MAAITRAITAVADHPRRCLAKTASGGLAPALSAFIIVAVSSMPIDLYTALPLFISTLQLQH